ncbi:hypothetical protein [Brevundimonas sp. DWR2-3-1b1]|uniref:hypothetical protein n=1 Tax=unclassified Brevundimonas TaxID=2622653 RepID=UPI003CFA96AA
MSDYILFENGDRWLFEDGSPHVNENAVEGPAEIIATLSKTLGSATATGAAIVVHPFRSASLNKTLGGLTVSSSVAVVPVRLADLTVALAPMVSASSASTIVAGSSASTLAGASLTAQGGVSISGSSNRTLSGLTLTSTAGSTIAASLIQSMGGMTAASPRP